MDLDDLIITAFCVTYDISHELLGDRRLIQKRPMPALADSEVVTMEVVGEYLPLVRTKPTSITSTDTTRICSRRSEQYTAQHSSDRRQTCGQATVLEVKLH